jgi:hypothetical protein
VASGDMFPCCSKCHLSVIACECPAEEKPLELADPAAVQAEVTKKFLTQVEEAKSIGAAAGKLAGIVARERGMQQRVACGLSFNLNNDAWEAYIGRPDSPAEGPVMRLWPYGEGVGTSPLEAVTLALAAFDTHIASVKQETQQPAEGDAPMI